MSASKSLTDNEIFSFGPWRLRWPERVLERDGVPVAIPEKTLDVLCVLVRNSGELIEREILLQEVWPDTFVEDTNIAFQISTLRRLLEESAAAPKFIATVPKRGYRFIADVIRDSDLHRTHNLAASEPMPPPPVPSFSWLREGIILAIGLTLFLAWFQLHGPHAQSFAALSEKGTIVLADFENKTGDRVFDGTLRQGLLVELQQSPVLSLLPEYRLRRTLALMRKSPTASLTHEISMAVCQRTGSSLVVEGSIERAGGLYVFGLRALTCDTGSLIDAEQAKAESKERVLDVLSAMVARFRSRVGEAAASLSRHNASLAEATTVSTDALKAYSTAWTLQATRGIAEAIPLLRRAVELDPNFAMAHAALGRMYADIDESDLSAESLQKAWNLKDHASDREQFFISFNYLALVKGNLEEARKVAESWAQTYPREAVPHTLLSGLPNKAVARFEEAASQARKAIEMDSDFGMSYYNLGVNYLYLQRTDAASNALEWAAKHGLDIEEFHMLAYDLAFVRRDAGTMDEIVEQTRRRSGPVSWLPNREAFRVAYSGQIRRSRELSSMAVAEAEQANEQERAGVWEAGSALREAMIGNFPEARKKAAAALHRTSDREVAYGASVALALAGNWLKAQSIADQLESRFPDDTSVRLTYVPVIRAVIALNRHKPEDAVQALKAAAATEMGAARSPVNTIYGALYPVYFRGLALYAQGQGARAAIEFRRIIDHSGIVASDPVGALAHVQLARSYRISGDIEKSKTAYQSFLELWKQADPEIPLLRQAKQEYRQMLARSARSY